MNNLLKCSPILIVLIFAQCGSSTMKGDPGNFEGIYYVGGSEAIVFPVYKAYEIEFQMFGEPILFFFDKINEEGKNVYVSDDKNLSFVMEPENLKGTFYEINEPPMKVEKE